MPRLVPSACVLASAVLLATPLSSCSRTGLRLPNFDEAPATDVPDAEEDKLCVTLPVDGSEAVVDLATDARLRRADVFFLLDVSGSMAAELREIRARLRNDIAPLIEATFPDVEYGVGSFSDFPVPEAGYGASDDRPFTLHLQMTDRLADVQEALDGLVITAGADAPESQVEALYQVATGAGLGRFISPSFGCPTGGFGAPCFRDDAEPVVLLFTDAPFHNGPRELGSDAYLPGLISPEPHSYAEARDALLSRRIRVIGLWSGDSDTFDRTDLAIAAGDSGARYADGSPLVFDIGRDGEQLGSGVVSSLSDFADAAVFDVGVIASDPDPTDDVDVRDFLAGVAPLRAEPMAGVAGIDVPGGRFLGVQAGTTVTFAVRLRADASVSWPRGRRVTIRLEFRGDDSIFLGDREVDIVIPGPGLDGC